MSIPQKRDNPFSLANIQARHRSVAHRLGAVEPPVRQPAVLPSALPKPGHQNDRKGKAGVIGAETPRKAGIGEQEQGVKGLVDTNDPSDVEGDLQVLDTPTSSQHALDDEPDHPMDSESDDEVLVIDYTEAPTTDIEMGPPIPGDTPSSVAEEFPILGESSRLQPVSECSPIPAKGAVSEAKNPYHPGDLLAELAHLLHDKEITETNVRKDFAQSVCANLFNNYSDLTNIIRTLHGPSLRIAMPPII